MLLVLGQKPQETAWENNPSSPSSSESWASLALGMGKMRHTSVMLVALGLVCAYPPWQSHKLHLCEWRRQ